MSGARRVRIAHLTSAHPRYDTRVFLKMCCSLARQAFDVTMVVADGEGAEVREGVSIVDAGASSGRLSRIAAAPRRVLRKALALDCDLYHLHDPELLFIGMALKRRGKRVVFDAHEDLPRQILSKSYLHPAFRWPIAGAAGVVERLACGGLDHVIAATPGIRDKFLSMGMEATDINNYPILGELETDALWSAKAREVAYVGGISEIRGIRQVVDAMALCRSGVRLNLAGGFAETHVKTGVEASAGWAGVNELGHLSREQVRDLLARSIAGIVTFLPVPNHVTAQPNKLFEYMSASLPVIASDFPLWRDIVEGAGCGLCVDPLSPGAIAGAIDHLAENPDTVREMGKNGRRAVYERFNWGVEEKKLLDLYSTLLSRG